MGSRISVGVFARRFLTEYNSENQPTTGEYQDILKLAKDESEKFFNNPWGFLSDRKGQEPASLQRLHLLKEAEIQNVALERKAATLYRLTMYPLTGFFPTELPTAGDLEDIKYLLGRLYGLYPGDRFYDSEQYHHLELWGRMAEMMATAIIREKRYGKTVAQLSSFVTLMKGVIGLMRHIPGFEDWTPWNMRPEYDIGDGNVYMTRLLNNPEMVRSIYEFRQEVEDVARVKKGFHALINVLAKMDAFTIPLERHIPYAVEGKGDEVRKGKKTVKAIIGPVLDLVEETYLVSGVTIHFLATLLIAVSGCAEPRTNLASLSRRKREASVTSKDCNGICAEGGDDVTIRVGHHQSVG